MGDEHNLSGNLMEIITPLTQSPFAALTFVAAPALLTNASSVLAMSTINRMLQTRNRMHELYNKSESGAQSEADAARLIKMVNRVETQGALLLRAIHSIYVALSSFASATLVTLLGAGAVPFKGELWLHILEWLGVGLGIAGVGGLVFGCVNLFHATHLSLINIREEASIVRERFAPFKERGADA
ncbi:MAG: DUF2721 domain-containing protein [Chloracidobacterium sp.]|nr:DUF2721 domain-containing protein [Chloracidobacterium sp.]